MTATLSGRTYVVTGAGSGIGRATALRLARAGANVAAADLGADALDRVCAEIKAAGGNALALPCDVRRAPDVAAAIERTCTTFGRLDGAFNNAGIAGPHRRVDEFSEADYDAIMDTNVRGVWLCMKHEIPIMLQQGAGAIVNTSSAIGLVGGPNQALYTASKHAVVGLTRTAALEVSARGVRVNCVCPGVIDTPLVATTAARENPDIRRIWNELHPIGRFGEADEVAALVVWLLSDEASFVTGAAMSVDGGYCTK